MTRGEAKYGDSLIDAVCDLLNARLPVLRAMAVAAEFSPDPPAVVAVADSAATLPPLPPALKFAAEAVLSAVRERLCLAIAKDVAARAGTVEGEKLWRAGAAKRAAHAQHAFDDYVRGHAERRARREKIARLKAGSTAPGARVLSAKHAQLRARIAALKLPVIQ
jgi:hypothetical protein